MQVPTACLQQQQQQKQNNKDDQKTKTTQTTKTKQELKTKTSNLSLLALADRLFASFLQIKSHVVVRLRVAFLNQEIFDFFRILHLEYLVIIVM